LVFVAFGLPVLLCCWLVGVVGILSGTHNPYRDGMTFGVEAIEEPTDAEPWWPWLVVAAGVVAIGWSVLR
jgi:hypothetical protein